MSDPLAAMTDPYVPETTPALHPAGRFVGAMPLVRADQRIAPIDDAVSRDRIGIVPQREDDASLSSARRDQLASTRRFLLVFRFALFNLAALALLGAVYLQGWIDTVLAADGTGLSVAIFATFLAGLLVSARKSWRLSTELDCVRNFNPCRESWASTHLADIARRSAGSRAITASVLRAKVTSRIAVVRHVANSLVLLGLIGTVIGFIIALSGVEPDAAGDVRAVAPMVADLISGMSVALYTTLVGAVLSLWLTVNYHILAGGAVRLITALVELGEANARPRAVS